MGALRDAEEGEITPASVMRGSRSRSVMMMKGLLRLSASLAAFTRQFDANDDRPKPLTV